MKENILEVEILETYCGTQANTEDGTNIPLPVFISQSISIAQGRALTIGMNSYSEGFVYRISVTNAKYQFINEQLGILKSGEIEIKEKIHVRRAEDGQLEKIERTTL